jgi:peptide/nickel transport system permease protein
VGSLIVRRVVVLIPTLLIVSFLVFSLVTLIPGDAATELAGGTRATPERIADVRTQLGLDDPFLVQYGRWLSDAAQFDLGESLRTGKPVSSEIRRLMPITASLVLAGVVIGLSLGVPMGVIAGMRPGTPLDRSLMFSATLGIAVPNFWLAMMLISVFAVEFSIFDFLGFRSIGFTRLTDDPVGWLQSIVLPGIALGLGVAASVGRQLRAALQDVLASNFVRTLWANGATPKLVVAKHALKNAAIPAVTVLGLQIGGLLGGTVLIERVFSIPGIGSYVLNGVLELDLPVVQGVAVLFVLINMTLSLLVDLTYSWLDPRVRVA